MGLMKVKIGRVTTRLAATWDAFFYPLTIELFIYC